MSRSGKSTAKQPPADRDGNPISNKILLRLPAGEFEHLFSKLEFVRLRPHHLLPEASHSIKSVHFVNSGLVSVLSVMSDGRSVEVGLIGKEGIVGLAVIGRFRRSSTRVLAQTDSTAFRLDAEVMTGMLHRCPQLVRQLHRFSQATAVQLAQISACNRLHQVDQRLARWLLMSQDRIGSKLLPLTQDFLAQMLGTRRASVTLAAGRLQRAGKITYTRGNVTILNRRALEEDACECYRLIRQYLEEETDSPFLYDGKHLMPKLFSIPLACQEKLKSSKGRRSSTLKVMPLRA
jgi:CRP-like cAMP-binding protein